MRILLLANKIPYPPKDGGSIATFSLADSFSKLGHEVTILTINTSKHYFEPSLIPEDIRNRIRFVSVYIDTDINPVKALVNLLFSGKPYNAVRFISSDFRKQLKELLSNEVYDVIQLEGLYLAPYVDDIRKWSKAVVSMRAHNVEHEIWQRTVRQQSGWKKRYVKILAGRIRNMEEKYLNRYDVMVPITDRDGKRFREMGCTLPMHTVPTGINTELIQPDRSDLEFPSIFHIGALDWMPNQEGLEWFAREVWPLVNKQFPELKFYIAGRNAPAFIREWNYPNVVFMGEVEDAYEFMNSKAIMIVPLLSGSGMRIKIIEGMALEKAIVSTSIGTEGISTTHEENILIAESPGEFSDQISRLIVDESLTQRIGQAARSFVRKNFDNLAIARSLINFYEQ